METNAKELASISDLKQVFLTKDDKIELIDRMHRLEISLEKSFGEKMWRYFLILLSTILTVGGTIIVLATTILARLPKQ